MVPLDIVGHAQANDHFSELVSALIAASTDLVGVLTGEGPFTVFAPTDEAFAKLPAGTIDSLLEPANRDQLTAILTYHVVAGAVTADQVVNLTEAATVNGQSVEISVADAGVMVDGATVIAADIMATNGVIHVIDSVILPE